MEQFNNYIEWLEFIKEQEDPNYYDNLVKFAPDIVKALEDGVKQSFIVQKLRMSGPSFSVIKPVLYAIVNRLDN